MGLDPDIHQVSEHIVVWQVFDLGVKAELSSTAIRGDHGTYLIDPVKLCDTRAKSVVSSWPAKIVLTNENHARATSEFSRTFKAPIYAHAEAQLGLHGLVINPITESGPLQDLEVIELAGAAAGEIALYNPTDGGTLILGDALINFGSNGFALLPSKYCHNQKLLRKSLQKLLDFDFARMLFAHGTPIVSNARRRLGDLLHADRR